MGHHVRYHLYSLRESQKNADYEISLEIDLFLVENKGRDVHVYYLEDLTIKK